jgi:hypothetical protein
MTPRASRSGEGLRRINAEIAHEKAAVLGRAGERLEAALEEVTALRLSVASAAEASERERLAEAYARAVARAREARLVLIIQREAVGLRQHRILDQLFPEPPRACP